MVQGSVQQIYFELLALARDAGSKSELLMETPRTLGARLGSPCVALYARLSAEVIERHWSAEGVAPGFWKPPVEEILQSGLEQAQPVGRLYREPGSGASVAVVSAPLRNPEGGQMGVLAAVLPCQDVGEARQLQVGVESLAHLVSCCCARFDIRGPEETVPAGLRAVEDWSRVAKYASVRELAFTISNNLRNRTSCEQVAFGLARGKRVEILSISGYDEVKSESPSVLQLLAAMEECLDMGETIVQQRGPWSADALDDSARSDYRLHRQWREANAGSAVASLLLPADEDRTAILSLQRAANAPFSPEEIEQIREMTAPYVAAFGLLDRASRSLPAHACAWIRALWQTARTPGQWTRKVAVVASLLLFGWIAVGSVDYRVTVPSTVIPSRSRHVSAPFEGILGAVHVTAGDRVRGGEVLAVFEHHELRLERDRLRAELQFQQLDAGEAMATREPVKVSLARARARLLAARLETLERKIEQAMVSAPFDGLVVKGDLRKRVGSRLPLGETLFEIAAEDGFRLQLEVPEYAAADLRVGLTGEFAAHARPDHTGFFSIERVTPQAESRRGANVYLAEAALDLREPWMRAGIEGLGKIDVGGKPVWWAAFHQVIDYLRLRFWL
jgi:biotin carboxyl carrier protein